MQSLNLGGGDGEDDEYDMVEDAGEAQNGTQTRNAQSKLKYMNVLQEVANRLRDNIVIDLNDVEAVSRVLWVVMVQS